MDVAGVGWLMLAVALLVFAFPDGRVWVRVALPLMVLIFYGTRALGHVGGHCRNLG